MTCRTLILTRSFGGEINPYPEGETPWPAPVPPPVPSPLSPPVPQPPPTINPSWVHPSWVDIVDPNYVPLTNPEIIRRSPTSRRSTRRRGLNDEYEAVRKDPNSWSLREAVELCKLIEVVLPEAGFHVALTGGLLYKEGRRKDCDLIFYQIRQQEPDYEVLWKYLTVAGIIRNPEYRENGWLVKATYRGKQVDCLFPNASSKKNRIKSNLGEQPIPYNVPIPEPTPVPPIGSCISGDAMAAMQSVEIGSSQNGGPIFNDPPPRRFRTTIRECAEAVTEELYQPVPIPGDFENTAAIPEPPF